ncbi:MAG: P-loop NTPase fold protein [Clostridium sp.]|nr:P-loop NTPase fold protein [Clostridium sp.]
MRDFKFDIPEDNPFQNDALDRKNIAVNLTNIIDSQQDGMVLAIDSEWGAGKTTFIRMWQTFLDNNVYEEKISTLYYNAWENDYIKEPLVSVLSELNEQIIEKEESIEIREKLEKAMNELKPLVKSSGKVLLNVLTKGVLEKYGISGLVKDALQQLSDNLGELAFEEVEMEKNIRKKLKDKLERFQEVADKKIVVFIDELDRCRPTYAIELLETIKHIFDLDNYIFVISLDKQQLGESIKTIYGSEMDTNGYLKRFFDMEYKLENPSIASFLMSKSNFIRNKYKDSDYFIEWLEFFILNSTLTLREIDKLYYYTNLLLSTEVELFNLDIGEDESKVKSFLYAYFIYLKFSDEDVFNKFISGDYANGEVNIYKDFKLNDIKDFPRNNKIKINDDYFQNVLVQCIAKYLIFEKSRHLENISRNSIVINNFYNDSREINLSLIFESDEASIKRRMAFLDNFNINRN